MTKATELDALEEAKSLKEKLETEVISTGKLETAKKGAAKLKKDLKEIREERESKTAEESQEELQEGTQGKWSDEVKFKAPPLAILEHKSTKGKKIMYQPIGAILDSIEEACGPRSRSFRDFKLNIDRTTPVGKTTTGHLVFLREAEGVLRVTLPNGEVFEETGQALGSTPSTKLASDDAARTLFKLAKAAVFKDAVRSLSSAFRIGSEEADDKSIITNEGNTDLIVDDLFDDVPKKKVVETVEETKTKVEEMTYRTILPEFHKILDPQDPDYKTKFVGMAGKFLQDRGFGPDSLERKELLTIYESIKGIS